MTKATTGEVLPPGFLLLSELAPQPETQATRKLVQIKIAALASSARIMDDPD